MGAPSASRRCASWRYGCSTSPACQLGITMASLGLGWIGEPAVSALLAPLFRQLALGPAAVHTISFSCSAS